MCLEGQLSICFFYRYNGTNLLSDLVREPSGSFHNFCRMSSEDFEYILNRISPFITKKNTKWRQSIPVKERLAVTLRFLATGDSFQSLHYLFKISPQVISRIVPEVCEAIIQDLKHLVKVRKINFYSYITNLGIQNIMVTA